MIASMLMIAPANAYSQAPMSEGKRQEARERYQAHLDKLKLTEEQKPKVDEVNKEYLQALATTRKSEASRLEKYNTLKQLRSTRDEKLKAILTEEQYAIYQDDQQERRKQLRERRRANR